jgi:single-strand DNA-binding protein
MINRVVLVGRLTRNPELKYTTNGIANIRFSLAANRAFKKDGQPQADFINCVAWRGQAENMAKFLRKGSLIGVEGRIETGSYQAQDGSTRYTTDVIADNVQFLEPKRSTDDYSQPEQYIAPKPEAGHYAGPAYKESSTQGNNQPFGGQSAMPGYNNPFQTAGQININDDDLPF